MIPKVVVFDLVGHLKKYRWEKFGNQSTCIYSKKPFVISTTFGLNMHKSATCNELVFVCILVTPSFKHRTIQKMTF